MYFIFLMYRKVPRKCPLSEQPCRRFHYRPQLSLPADVHCKHSEQYSQRSWQNRTYFRLQYVKSFGTAWICLFRYPPVGHPRLPVGASGQPGGTDPAVHVCSAQIPLTKIQSFVHHYRTQIPLAELLRLYLCSRPILPAGASGILYAKPLTGLLFMRPLLIHTELEFFHHVLQCGCLCGQFLTGSGSFFGCC